MGGTARLFVMLSLRLGTLLLITASLVSAAPPDGGDASPTKLPSPAVTFAKPTGLTTRLTDDAHVDLTWQNPATAAGGVNVEFNLGEETDFSILDILPGRVTALRHPDVARANRFKYRLLPFFGEPSAPAVIKTGDEPPARTRDDVEGPLPAVPGRTTVNVAPVSLRKADTFAKAAPTELTAVLHGPVRVDLRWLDHAQDEDGYLVEISANEGRDWKVCALLPPDTTSFRKIGLPPQTTLRFAVRAFFYGQPSNVASIDIPPAP